MANKLTDLVPVLASSFYELKTKKELKNLFTLLDIQSEREEEPKESFLNKNLCKLNESQLLDFVNKFFVIPKWTCTLEEKDKKQKEFATNFQQFLEFSKKDNAFVLKNPSLSNEAGKIYFEGIEKQILESIEQAKILIWAAIYFFTNKKLMQAIEKKHQEGVHIAIFVDKHDANNHLVENYQWAKKLKLPVEGALLHNKFVIFDCDKAWSGSYNWTIAAENKNEENYAELSQAQARDCMKEFTSLRKMYYEEIAKTKK